MKNQYIRKTRLFQTGWTWRVDVWTGKLLALLDCLIFLVSFSYYSGRLEYLYHMWRIPHRLDEGLFDPKDKS